MKVVLFRGVYNGRLACSEEVPYLKALGAVHLLCSGCLVCNSCPKERLDSQHQVSWPTSLILLPSFQYTEAQTNHGMQHNSMVPMTSFHNFFSHNARCCRTFLFCCSYSRHRTNERTMLRWIANVPCHIFMLQYTFFFSSTLNCPGPMFTNSRRPPL